MGHEPSNADASNESLASVKNRLSPRRWLNYPEVRAGGIIAVMMAASTALISPAAAQMGNKVGNAICKTGAGKLITAALFIVAILLIYGAIGDAYKGIKKGRSKNTGQRSKQGNDFENAGMKLVGGVLIAASPTILATIGFSLLSCVKAVQIF